MLTDNAQTYGVILLTGDPSLFFDRVDRSDGPWLSAAVDPDAHVDYLLLSTNPALDLLSRRYPDAATGADPVLRPVAATDRYVLVAVPDGYEYGEVPTDAAADPEPDGLDELGGVDGVIGEKGTP